MKTIKITYWISTLLIAGIMTMSAFMQLFATSSMIESMNKLGLPLHIIYLLGILKAFGALALLFPGYPKIREWAYAGFVFLLIGATYLHFAVGDYQPVTLILLAIVFTSYFTGRKITSLQEKKLRLA